MGVGVSEPAPSFEGFVIARRTALVRFAYLLTADLDQAQDVVQEVLARLHLKWSRTQQVECLDAYVKKAIVRQFLSWRRRRSSGEAIVANLPEAPARVDAMDEYVERDAMWALLANLPRQQRAVLVLRYYEDLDDATIAAELGCRPATVRSYAALAVAKLRAAMPAAPVTPEPARGVGR